MHWAAGGATVGIGGESYNSLDPESNKCYKKSIVDKRVCNLKASLLNI